MIGSLVRNERVKLTASYLNGIALAVLAVGVFAPTVSLITGTSRQSLWAIAVLVLTCVLISALLHWYARLTLRGLRE